MGLFDFLKIKNNGIEKKQDEPQENISPEIKECLTKAKEGDTEAQYQLGIYYIEKFRWDRDDTHSLHQANIWFRKTAEAGLVDAMYCLHLYSGYLERDPDIKDDGNYNNSWVKKQQNWDMPGHRTGWGTVMQMGMM